MATWPCPLGPVIGRVELRVSVWGHVQEFAAPPDPVSLHVGLVAPRPHQKRQPLWDCGDLEKPEEKEAMWGQALCWKADAQGSICT